MFPAVHWKHYNPYLVNMNKLVQIKAIKCFTVVCSKAMHSYMMVIDHNLCRPSFPLNSTIIATEGVTACVHAASEYPVIVLPD